MEKNKIVAIVLFVLGALFGIAALVSYLAGFAARTTTDSRLTSSEATNGLVMYLGGETLTQSEPSDAKSVQWKDIFNSSITFTPYAVVTSTNTVATNDVSGRKYIHNTASPDPNSWAVSNYTQSTYAITCNTNASDIVGFPTANAERTLMFLVNGGQFMYVAASETSNSSFTISMDANGIYMCEQGVNCGGMFTFPTKLDPNKIYAVVIVRLSASTNDWVYYVIDESNDAAPPMTSSVTWEYATRNTWSDLLGNTRSAYGKPDMRITPGTSVYAHAVYKVAMNETTVVNVAKQLFNDNVRPSVTYATEASKGKLETYSFVVGKAATATGPTIRGKITSLTVSPPLPEGITINPSTGVLSGTPKVLATAQTYLVVINNVASNTTSFELAVVEEESSITVGAESDPTITPPPPINTNMYTILASVLETDTATTSAATSSSDSPALNPASSPATTTESYNPFLVFGFTGAAVACLIGAAAAWLNPIFKANINAPESRR